MRRLYSFLLFLTFILISQTGMAQDDKIIPVKIITAPPVTELTSAIMARQNVEAPPVTRLRPVKLRRDRSGIPDNPLSPALPYPYYPYDPSVTETGRVTVPYTPQTIGTDFNGVTGPTETGAFPPDNMGTIGPSQYIVFVNGRIRSFNKNTGVADAVVNLDPDVFFASVMTPPVGAEVVFCSDPRIRYDRLTARWYMIIIDVVIDGGTGAFTRPNRQLIAVSDAASAGVITGGTVWTFYQFQADATLFHDYCTLGVDEDAFYIGGNMFNLGPPATFNSTKGWVIPKAPLLAGTPLTVWAFSGLAVGAGAGPFTPQGVDNFATGTNEGYFLGVDNATFNTLMLRRITNPGSLGPAPTISANISIATPLTTRFPVDVPHLGNAGGLNGRVDALDDRLYAAVMRNGSIWTAHNIGVNNTGVAGATNNRNAARWYEVQNIVSPGVPSVLQSGTLYDDNATNDVNQRNYWIPTIMVSGQGHAALGTCIAGTNERINTFATGRLATSTLGTMLDGPGGAALPGITASSTAYNPPGDPGGSGGRRWGDYSYVALDPLDDMSMWMINQYCNGTNTYGCRVTKLVAPPPATPTTCLPASTATGQASVNIVVTGLSVAGSGFYDPGANLPAPALPFTHITASVSGGVTVNSVTYTNPTTVTLNINTTAAPAGLKDVTITNPDGQSRTGVGILLITAAAGPVIVTATAATPGPTDYPTVKDAFDALNAGTHQGAITVSVIANTTETASAVLNASGVGAASYTSVNMSATVPVTISGSIVGAIIKLNGADNVTIDGRIAGVGRNITISNTSNTTATAAVWISSTGAGAGATGNTIRNLNLACGANQSTGTLSTFGIISSGATIATSSAGDDNDNNSYIDNNITKSRYGISVRGNATGPNLNENTMISDNLIGPASFGIDQIGKVGIYAQFQNNCTITRNEIRFVGGTFATTTGGADRVGIGLGGESWSSTPSNSTSTNFTVTRNLVHDIIEERTFSAVGIASSTTNGGSPTNNLICSNMIYNVRANGTLGDVGIGIGISGGDADNVVYNSVRMEGDIDPAGTSTATQSVMGLRIANTPTNLSVKNNILYVDISSNTAALLHACIQVQTATFAFGTGGLNYNDYYFPVANTQMRTGAIGTTSAPTTFFTILAAWQAALTPPQNTNSVQGDPMFTSATNLHINAASVVNNSGTPVGCTIDFDNDTRSVTTPDMGADENTFPVLIGPDISVTKTDSPDPVVAGGLITYTITATNNGAGTPALMGIVDAIPAGTSFVSATGGAPTVPDPAVGATSGTIIHQFAGVPPGNSVVMTVVVMVNPGTPSGTIISNTAAAGSSTELGPDPNPLNNTDTELTTVSGGPDISVTKTDSPDPIGPGGLITYTITATNNGPGTPATMTIQDPIPAGTSFVSATGGVANPADPPVGATIGTISHDFPGVPPGNSVVLTVVVMVDPGTPDGTIISNTATASSSAELGVDPNLANNTDTELTTVTNPCILTCPANITVSNDPNQCGAVVTYPPPGSSGTCGTVTYSPVSGSFFPIGTTTVTATSSIGGSTCSFTVTVNDTQPPAPLTCPANITQSNDPNQCGAVVTYTTPIATDNCPGTTVVVVPASGSFFPLGTTTVTATATDAGGNTATCTFTVTVNDTQPPAPMTCPANITVSNDLNQCGAVVTYTTPIATDNCPGTTVVVVPASGSFFPLGTTTVTATATDAGGNTATCTFTVTVNDTQPPAPMTCPANITVPNDPNQCGAVVTYTTPIASDNCPGTTVAVVPASGSFFPLGTTTVTATATDAGGNTTTCTFTVTVNDVQPPTINCPSNITLCGGPQVVNYIVSASDPCGIMSLTAVPASGSVFPVGTTTVIATATDPVGNTSTCSFTVTINPPPVATATPASQTRCSGIAIATIVLSSSTPGTTYTWIRDNVATVTGIAANGTGNISGTLTNTTTAPITVTFTITPTAGGCTGSDITATVLVNPTPNVVAAPTSQTICSGTAITPIALSGNVAGTTYTWTRTNTVNITGMAASGSGNPITGTLNNNTTTVQTTTFTITPSANGCAGPATTATVTVNPLPGVVLPSVQVVIIGNGSFADEITWTLTNSLNVVVLSGGPYGLNPPPTFSAPTPSVNAPFSFFIEAQGFFNDNACLWEVRCNGVVVANGCIRGTANGGSCVNVGTLTVPGIPGCSPLAPQTICSGTAITPINLTGTVAGTTFSWTRDNNVNVTGIPASGTGMPISGTLTNTTNVPQTVIFTVIPSANGCPGPPVTISILVNPTPNAVATPSSQTICSGAAITPMVLTSNVAGTTYAWTRDNTANVTGMPAAGSGTPISGNLTNTTTSLQTTTFAITPTANGCAGPVTNATVSVQAPLILTCPANMTVNAGAGTCTAVVNFAATVTGTPVPTVTYVPASGSVFPIGTTTVTVTATNSCATQVCTFTVTVLDVQIPVITSLPNQFICVGSSVTFTAVSTFAVSFQWQSWNGSAWVNIPGATSSTYTINNVTHAMNATSYRVRVTGPCGTVTTSNHAILYVNSLPTITITSNIQPQLLPGQFITLTATGTPPGGSFVWRKNGSVIAGATGSTLGPLNVLDVGVYTVTYTDLNGCVSTSAPFTISALLTGNLYIYPNPNTGQFHIRFFNAANEEATVTVYNYLGAIVYQKKHMTGPLQYSIIDVDLGKRLAIGTYIVEVRNALDVRIGAKLISVGRN